LSNLPPQILLTGNHSGSLGGTVMSAGSTGGNQQPPISPPASSSFA
jgi:hypothetical protein